MSSPSPFQSWGILYVHVLLRRVSRPTSQKVHLYVTGGKTPGGNLIDRGGNREGNVRGKALDGKAPGGKPPDTGCRPTIFSHFLANDLQPL